MFIQCIMSVANFVRDNKLLYSSVPCEPQIRENTEASVLQIQDGSDNVTFAKIGGFALNAGMLYTCKLEMLLGKVTTDVSPDSVLIFEIQYRQGQNGEWKITQPQKVLTNAGANDKDQIVFQSFQQTFQFVANGENELQFRISKKSTSFQEALILIVSGSDAIGTVNFPVITASVW